MPSLTAVGSPVPLRRLPGLVLAVLLASFVAACGGGGGSTADPAPTAPSISTQPNDQSVVEGTAATFAVVGTGTSPLSYQWSSSTDGVTFTAIPGATAAIYVVNATTPVQSGTQFRVVVSNSAGGVTSSAVRLTVTAIVVAPEIAVQPASQTVLTDATATFSVTASGAGLSYQWKKNGTTIVGATAATYTTPVATWVDSGAQYTVVVTNTGGTMTSNAAQLSLSLSANQQAFEDLIVAPASGSYRFKWNLNYSGPETSGVNYAWSDFGVLSQSPLTHGPQTNAQAAPVNLTSTLALISGTVTRVLKNGTILVVPPTQVSSIVSYVGSDVRVDTLASDNTTIALSQIRTDYAVVPLTGVLAGSADDFAHYHNSFFSNSLILNSTSTYLAGASYVKYSAHVIGDRYTAFDCAAATTDANITPCRTGTTLAAALTAGITSTSDATTYLLADGTVSTVGGLPVWIATAPRPVSAVLSTVAQYRVYFQMNGNVYTGSLLKDGSLEATSYYVSNPSGATVTDRLTFLPFQIRMNKAARDSVAAAMAL